MQRLKRLSQYFDLPAGVKTFFKSYADVLFVHQVPLGAVFFLLTFLQPNVAVTGILSVLSAITAGRLIGISETVLKNATFTYNPLLVGLAIGYLFEIDVMMLLLVIVASSATFFITLLAQSVAQNLGLPVLSIPFTIVSSFVFLASKQYYNLLDLTFYNFERQYGFLLGVPDLFVGFFRSIGLIFYLPDPVIGFGFFVLVFYSSPLIAFFLFCGFAEGVFIEYLLKGSSHNLFYNPYLFNYSLVFAALSGVFMVPSLRSLTLSTIAVAMTVLVANASQEIMGTFGIPVFALPFNIIVICMIHALNYSKSPVRNLYGDLTPEESLDKSSLRTLRFRSGEPAIYCPFADKWTVSQGMNGEYTHTGPWKYALDFQKYDEYGKTFENNGYELQDYYCYGQPLYAPLSGYVVANINWHPDNVIGGVDNQNNWGNYLVIRGLTGHFVLMAHLQQHSCQLVVGQYIEVGHFVANCGNSGYSPEPHLHIQVQETAYAGDKTIPFNMMNYRRGDNVTFHGVPQHLQKIEPIAFNPNLSRSLSFYVDQKFIYHANYGGESRENIVVHNRLDQVSGVMFLEHGESKLYYWKNGASFYFYHLEGTGSQFLNSLLFALPRIPMTYGNVANYTDYFSLSLQESRLQKWSKFFMQIISKQPVHHAGQFSFDPTKLEVNGQVKRSSEITNTYCKLDPLLGITKIKVGNTNYELATKTFATGDAITIDASAGAESLVA